MGLSYTDFLTRIVSARFGMPAPTLSYHYKEEPGQSELELPMTG